MRVRFRATRRRVRAIALGHDGLQDRRARRHLHHRDTRAHLPRDGREQVAGGAGDLAAAALALVLVEEHDLDIPFPSPSSQVVVAHHAVEVEGGYGSDIGLQRRNLGYLAQGLGQAPGHVRRDRQGRPLRQVNHDVELGLVVEGQHLHRHRLGVEHGAGKSEGQDDKAQQDPGEGAAADEGRDDGSIDLADDLLHPVLPLLGTLQGIELGP